MVKANRILTEDSRLDLLKITGLHTSSKDGPIHSENCLEEAMRISFAGFTLQMGQPTVGVHQTMALAQRETVRSRVS